MKIKIVIAVLLTVVLLAGCVYSGESISLEQVLGIQREEKNNYPEISSVLQLRDHIARQREQGNTEITFVYTGVEEIDPGIVAQMADVCYVKMIQEGNVYRLEMTVFPGERIVDAYFSGTTESLSLDEKKALEIAAEIVKDAKDQAADNWELELLLHDMLSERISYSDADIHYETPEDQPRHLSVIGGLLDGQANCQGYTDAFYTLASLAGFEVGRLSVETDTDPHMVNTICLDGSWYVVDLTYDDADDAAISYQLFNAGMDMIGKEYWWDEATEANIIVANSDENSYYIRNGLVFDDIEALAEFIAESWAEMGNTQIHAMLQNESDSEKLNEVLPDALEKWGRSYSYSLWHSSNGADSFYTVVFE